jgi:hypothetical protein
MIMAQNAQTELIDIERLLVANSIQIDAMHQLLIEKGFFTEAEFMAKMKKVQADYQKKQGPAES